jgi:hypothetical protein
MWCYAGENAGWGYEESYQVQRPNGDCPDRGEEYVAYPRTGARGWKIVVYIVFGCYPGGYGHLDNGEDDEGNERD